MKRIVLICTLLFSIVGCVTSGGVQVNQDQLTEFKKGVTTESDVIKALGKPNASTVSSTGTKIIIYSSMQNKIRGATFIPIVGIFAGGSDVHMASTTFTFGEDGKLTSFQSTESNYGASMNRPAGKSAPETDQPR